MSRDTTLAGSSLHSLAAINYEIKASPGERERLDTRFESQRVVEAHFYGLKCQKTFRSLS